MDFKIGPSVDEYIAASLEAIDEPGGREALVRALRRVAKAQGEKSADNEEGPWLAQHVNVNPTLKARILDALFEPEWQAIAARDKATDEALSLTDIDLRGELVFVKHGYYPVSAMAMIEHFHGKFTAGDPYDEQVLCEFIQHAFGLIVAGKSADIAFGLKRNNVRPTADGLMERNLRIAACVEIFKKDLEAERGSKKCVYEDAVTLTAEKFTVGTSAVKAAYTEHREAINLLSDEEARTLIK